MKTVFLSMFLLAAAISNAQTFKGFYLGTTNVKNISDTDTLVQKKEVFWTGVFQSGEANYFTYSVKTTENGITTAFNPELIVIVEPTDSVFISPLGKRSVNDFIPLLYQNGDTTRWKKAAKQPIARAFKNRVIK